MKEQTALERLCQIKSPYELNEENKKLFIGAIKENYRFQYENQPYVRFLAERNDFDISKVKTINDLAKIPAIFVGTMKRTTFCNLKENEVAMVLTSSGTKGEKTQSFFGKDDLERLSSLGRNCFEASGWTSTIPSHVFLFAHDIKEEKNRGTSWSNDQLSSLAPQKSTHWMIVKNAQGDFDFDYKFWAKKVVELAQDAPIRLVGFPAFMAQLANEISQIAPNFKAKEGSFITAGGGWKNHSGTPMTFSQFADFIGKTLGIPAHSIRDIFGMAEHGIPYCSCKAGHYHVPLYSRIFIRDPLTLEVLPDGEEGIMNLISPYNMAQSNLSILATDLGIIQDNCSCGIKGKFISSIRRGGISKNRGCAIAAQEILDRAQGVRK